MQKDSVTRTLRARQRYVIGNYAVTPQWGTRRHVNRWRSEGGPGQRMWWDEALPASP